MKYASLFFIVLLSIFVTAGVITPEIKKTPQDNDAVYNGQDFESKKFGEGFFAPIIRAFYQSVDYVTGDKKKLAIHKEQEAATCLFSRIELRSNTGYYGEEWTPRLESCVSEKVRTAIITQMGTQLLERRDPNDPKGERIIREGTVEELLSPVVRCYDSKYNSITGVGDDFTAYLFGVKVFGRCANVAFKGPVPIADKTLTEKSDQVEKWAFESPDFPSLVAEDRDKFPKVVILVQCNDDKNKAKGSGEFNLCAYRVPWDVGHKDEPEAAEKLMIEIRPIAGSDKSRIIFTGFGGAAIEVSSISLVSGTYFSDDCTQKTSSGSSICLKITSKDNKLLFGLYEQRPQGFGNKEFGIYRAVEIGGTSYGGGTLLSLLDKSQVTDFYGTRLFTGK